MSLANLSWIPGVKPLAIKDYLFTEILDKFSDLIFFHDNEYKIIKTNKSYLEYLGLTKDQVIGKSYWDIFPKRINNSKKCLDEFLQENTNCEDVKDHLDHSFYEKAIAITDINKNHLYSIHILRQESLPVNERESHHRKDILDRLANGTFHTFFSILEHHGNLYLLDHHRVGYLAAIIARQLNFSEEALKNIYLGGVLIDIGTFFVPDEVLYSPRHLSDIEFTLVQSHTEAGFEILNEIPIGGMVADMVLQHHERCDGTGYPKGLGGDEVMLEAKILGVADTVIAMISDRPYRAALGLDMALSTIKRQSGVKFDPTVVAACVKVFADSLVDLDIIQLK